MYDLETILNGFAACGVRGVVTDHGSRWLIKCYCRDKLTILAEIEEGLSERVGSFTNGRFWIFATIFGKLWVGCSVF